jgi:nucleoside-diphosphate-sugar epimerase
MRVLVLGGNGFIGFEICRALQAHGHIVHCARAIPEAQNAACPALPGFATTFERSGRH